MCDPEAMTYDSERRGGGPVPVLRDDWREPLRAAGSARLELRADSFQPGQAAPVAQTNLAGPVRVDLRLACLCAARADGADRGGVVPDGDRDQRAASSIEGSGAGPPAIGSVGTAIIDAPPRELTVFDANLPTGMLPDGGAFTQAGDKTWRVLAGTTPQIGQGAAKVFRYTVEVENGIDPAAFGGDDAFARMVDQTLANPKSWTHNPQFAFIRIDASAPGSPDFRISLSSPMTVREGCGYEFPLETSCYNPSYGPEGQPRVFINEARWVRGAVPFEGDVGSYRQYVINHEVGHAIGYLRHESCDAQGGLAPVMMQQTFSTSDNDAAKFDPEWVKPDGKTCRFNPWPYPIA